MDLITKERIGKWDALIVNNEVDGIYTIVFSENEKAIVSDKDLSIAKAKFLEVMELAESISKLNLFSKNNANDL